MYDRQQLKEFMATHPSVRSDALGLVYRIIDGYYDEVVQQLGDVPPQNSPIKLMMTAVDDSGSMRLKEGTQEVSNGELVEKAYNTLVDALQRSSAQYRTMLSTMLFNNGTVHAFERLLEAPKLELQPTKWATPLHRSALIAMVVLLVKSAILLEESSIQSSTTLVLLSDGVNYGNDEFHARDVSRLAESMLAGQRIKHQFIAIGVSHPDAPDYDSLFASLGVPEGFRRTVHSDPHAFRVLLDEVTSSIEQHGGGQGAGEIIGGPGRNARPVEEEETEPLGVLPGYPGARDGTTTPLQPGVDPWPQGNFGGYAQF